jgi:hypothetical protein
MCGNAKEISIRKIRDFNSNLIVVEIEDSDGRIVRDIWTIERFNSYSDPH